MKYRTVYLGEAEDSTIYALSPRIYVEDVESGRDCIPQGNPRERVP